MIKTLEERPLDLPADRQQQTLLDAARKNEENSDDREIGLLQLYFTLAFDCLSDGQCRKLLARIVRYDDQIRREVTAALDRFDEEQSS